MNSGKYSKLMLHAISCLLFVAFLCLFLSCNRNSKNVSAENDFPAVYSGAAPSAILQTGKQPLWFQLTENEPLLLESIEDAVFSSALVPWTLAAHIRFFHEKDGELIMAINRGGFIKFALYGDTDRSINMYCFSGGEFWRQYTVGGFVYFEENPVVLLYLDERFLNSSSPLPLPRTWSFNMTSNNPFPIDIPSLEIFSVEEGWSVDTLRPGNDKLFYFRAAKRDASQPEIRMLRTHDLSQPGADISIDTFFNSIPFKREISYASLPPLPEGFVYTGTGQVGNTVIGFWEEQEEFYIGAAGFVAVRVD